MRFKQSWCNFAVKNNLYDYILFYFQQLYHTSKLNQFISNFTELQTQIQTNQLIKGSIKGFDKKDSRTTRYWFTLLVPNKKFLTAILHYSKHRPKRPEGTTDQKEWHQKKEKGFRRRNTTVYKTICPQVLRDNAVQWYGWSFYLAWLGVATCLGTMTLFLIAASCLRREHAREQAQNVQYIMPGDTKTLKRPY